MQKSRIDQHSALVAKNITSNNVFMPSYNGTVNLNYLCVKGWHQLKFGWWCEVTLTE
jgi:hypothetical protein